MIRDRELIENVANESGSTRRDVYCVLRAAVGIIVNDLAAGRDVQIRGLGKFFPTLRAERKGRHFGSGQTITLPRVTVIRYRMSKLLKRKLANRLDRV